jgi:hypothetical protein
MQHDFLVLYPLNAAAVARYRQAFATSRAKDDPPTPNCYSTCWPNIATSFDPGNPTPPPPANWPPWAKPADKPSICAPAWPVGSSPRSKAITGKPSN